ncbi:opsin-5 isoform X1 [Nothobranchius furzeri]|uniref:opsin-5 isoform X1 n=1 Tax=Nothobranchius furzeri TaxID=105023 RepID=UPI00390464E2
MALMAEDTAFRSKIPVSLDIVVAVVYSVFGVSSLVGNITLLCISYKKRHLLKPAEFFIINLAISDLGLTLSLYPTAITSSIYHRWLYGKTFCSIYAFCGILFGLCSLTTLTLLSMVCFVKVCYPHYGNRFNSLHGQLLIACAWVYALMFACSPLFHWGEYGLEPYGTACCIDWRLSNQHPTARSYTVALFVFCYIIPCCIIIASYTGLLVTVQASRKTMEQHVLRQKSMTSIQTIIVKLSVAVCIGFFVAWSPYAVVSMWATFGHIESVPPLAFAVAAMFAKSSTIYNPIIYLTLRPNFHRLMCTDLRTCFETCLKGCLCLKGGTKSKPRIKVRLRTIQRETNQFPSSISAAQPPIVTLKDSSFQRCKDSFEQFQLYPQVGGITNPANTNSSKLQDTPVPQTHNQTSDNTSPENALATIRTSETYNFNIHLEMVQRHTKQAWP